MVEVRVKVPQPWSGVLGAQNLPSWHALPSPSICCPPSLVGCTVDIDTIASELPKPVPATPPPVVVLEEPAVLPPATAPPPGLVMRIVLTLPESPLHPPTAVATASAKAQRIDPIWTSNRAPELPTCPKQLCGGAADKTR
jgi:hypothetical protein